MFDIKLNYSTVAKVPIDFFIFATAVTPVTATHRLESIMTMRFVAGLLVISRDELGIFALLQRRGEWDYEHNRWESYPSGCQVTCSGGVENEDEKDTRRTMLREADQELGPAFTQHILAAGPQHLMRVRTESMNREADFYWVELAPEKLADIRLHPSSGGLVRFRPGRDMRNMYLECTREEGVLDRTVIAAYPETKQAVERAFEIVQK